MGKPEADIEGYLVARCKLVDAEIRKVSWIGRRGCPDRFVMPKGENTINFWAEVKREGGRIEPGSQQEREITRLRERGEIVYVFNSRDQIDAALPLVRR